MVVTALLSKDAASTLGMALALQWKAVVSLTAPSLHDVTLNSMDATGDTGLVYI
jgi:hypothetical protein